MIFNAYLRATNLRDGRTDLDTEGYGRIRKGMSGFGRMDGFGHRRVWPDSDGRTVSDTEGYGRIRTDGRIQ